MLGEAGRPPSVLWQKLRFMAQKSTVAYNVRGLQLLKYPALTIVKHTKKKKSMKLISVSLLILKKYKIK